MNEQVDLSSPEVTAAIKAAVDEAITGLKNKNTELLSELKKARKDSAIDPEDYNRLKEDKLELEHKLDETNKLLKLEQSNAEKVKKSYETEAGFTSKLLIDNGLTEALVAAGVKPELMKAAKAMFVNSAVIKANGETRTALIGDKQISDFVKEWSASDEGKHFVLAPNNSGGGANGGGQGAGKNQVTRTQFDSMGHQDRATFAKSGGVVIDG
jgi:hypothetical protein